MYKIKFVNDQEFDSLPGRDMPSKMGVAYPEYGEAYVRESGAKIVDVFTAMHELEHLKGSDLNEHFDAENKCYYKDTGQWMQTAAPFMNLIPGIGTIASIGMGAGGTALHNSSVAGQQKQAMNQQQDQQNQYNQQLMGQFDQTANQNMPNVIQTGQGGMGSQPGGGFSPSGGLNGPQGQDMMKQFGDYSGRSF